LRRVEELAVREDDLSFDPRAFNALPFKERMRLCLRFATRAQALADAAEPEYRRYYFVIAEQWLALADHMEEEMPADEDILEH
jgi:hypothetical protein